MSTQIQRRRGTTAQHSSFTGALGETTIDTDKEVVVVHDGVQVGGYPQMRENGSNSALALGSAGTPSLKFTGDPNTGIYSPGADQVAISTNGTGQLFIDASGRVGINKSALSQTFHVKSASGGTTSRFENLSSGNFLDFYETTGNTRMGYIGHLSATDMYIHNDKAGPLVFDTNNIERLRITSAGLVGIGTSSPSAKLDVAGNEGIIVSGFNANTGLRLNYGNSVTGQISAINLIANGITNGYIGMQMVDGSNGDLWLGGSGGRALTVYRDGKVGVGTSSPSSTLLHVYTDSPTTVSAANICLEGGTNGYGAGVNFASRTSAGGTLVSMAKITADGDDAWNTTASTQDASLRFFTALNGSLGERLRITSDGKVGVGTTAPLAIVDITGSGEPLRIQSTTASNNYITHKHNSSGDIAYIGAGGGAALSSGANTDYAIRAHQGALLFGTNGNNERARIDSSGRLLVGTSSSVDANCLVQSINAGESSIALGRNDTTVSAGNVFGGLTFYGNSDGVYDDISYVRCVADGTHTTSGTISKPTRLEFSTTADGASSPTERMRITEAGEIWINRTTRDAVVGTGCKLQVLGTGAEWSTIIRNSNGATPYGLYIKHDVDANTNTNSFWVGNGGGVNRGYLASNGGIYNYSGNNSNLCDEREKKNIENLESTWDCLKHWELKKFHYNEDADTEIKRYGVIAQQVEQHCPEVITEWTKGKDENGEDILRKGVKEQQMYWMAIKALQEAQVRIEALEASNADLLARVSALESA